MKKINTLWFLILSSLTFVYGDCSSYKAAYDLAVTQLSWIPYCDSYTLSSLINQKWSNNAIYARSGITGSNFNASSNQALDSQISQCQNYINFTSQKNAAANQYNSCNATEQQNNADNLTALFNAWYDSVKAGNFDDGIKYYNQYLLANNNPSDSNFQIALGNVIIAYNGQAQALLNKKDYYWLIENRKIVLIADPKNFLAQYWLWLWYFYLWFYDLALQNYQKALDLAIDVNDIKTASTAIQSVKDKIAQETFKKDMPVSDKPLAESIDSSTDASFLASSGIINKQDTEDGYNLKSNVLRQEVIGMAMKLGKFDLPNDYICQKVFLDVSSTKPNNWACRAIEIGVTKGIVSSLNKTFRPESTITRAEALAILMRAAWIKVEDSSGVSKFTDVKEGWQINVVNTALSNGFIDLSDNFYPNKNATRGEIFNMAKRILKSKI